MNFLTPKTIKLIGLNARYVHSCLALFYVRNELYRFAPELDVHLRQYTINDNYYELLLRLSNGAPQHIFFSAAIWNSDLITRFVRDLALCLPSSRCVIGGPQAHVLASILGESLSTVVLGEIERVDPQFYDDLNCGSLKPLYEPSASKLHNQSFDFPYLPSDFEDGLKNRHIYYESSRGCPFRCSYCLSSIEKNLHHKPLDVVAAELAVILAQKPKVVRFVDRTFNDNPGRALAIWKLLTENGQGTLFHFEMAPDRVSEEMFDFLSSVPSGLFQFEIGIQSTNAATLQAVNRRIDTTKIHGTITRLAQLGTIHLHVDLILGLPYESEESFAQSFRDVFAMGAHYIQMGLLKILPNTPISGQIEEFCYVSQQDPPYSILATKWLDHVSISRLYWFSECVEKFLNNRYFTTLWKYFRVQGEDIWDFFSELLDSCQASGFFERAPTQELMTSMLAAMFAGRVDEELLLDLLRFDWLRCGFRFLPESLVLKEGREQPEATRDRLYQNMPTVLDGVYGQSSRNHFFRKSFFVRFLPETFTVIELSLLAEEGCICFLSERDNMLYGYTRIVGW